MNKKILKFEIDLDFVLIAVTTSLKDYRICFLINKYLHFNFTKTTDHEIEQSAGNGPAFFSMYSDHWEAGGTDFYFIANKGTEGYLVPEMNKTDYFLMIKNYIDDDDLDNMLSGLNKIPEIVAAVKIDPKKLKSRENLLF